LQLTMKNHLTELRREEEGAVMVMAAILIIVLLSFAALAVDLGSLFVTRRQAQTAADVAALSGAQFSAGLTGTDARKAINDEVQRIMATNLGTTGPDWTSCADADAPAEFTQTAPAGSTATATSCVSFTATLDKIRVRVPTQSISTYFAGVMGISTLHTSAFAEVEFYWEESGDILPFGVPTLDGPNTLGCPSDHPNGVLPCNGPEAGNFNQLFVTQWGSDETTLNCNNSGEVFEENLAIGVDHLLGTIDMHSLRDEDACDDPNVNARPSIIGQDPGVSQSVLEPGLVSGTNSGLPGRLTDTPYTTDPLTSGGTTYDVDNEPLWSFIGSGLSSVPATCQADTFNRAHDSGPLLDAATYPDVVHPTEPDLYDWDKEWWVEYWILQGTPGLPEPDPVYEYNDSFEHMWRCLRDYAAGPYSGVLFNKDDDNKADAFFNLQRSPRWGWAPLSDFGSGSADFPIESFKPIFVQTIVSKCNANVCDWQWQAGESLPSPVLSPAKIQSLVSFQIPFSALPFAVNEASPGADVANTYRLSR
jgi:Flp pilus assembly protein TadG